VKAVTCLGAATPASIWWAGFLINPGLTSDIIVPFRNRLSSLARLASSEFSDDPAQRACTCIVLADYDTKLTGVPPWQNPSCIATYNTRHRMYMQENDFDEYARRLEVRRAATTVALVLR